MEKFGKLSGIVAPLDRSNVDTDMIIPKQFLKSIKRTGFGPNLFDEWRYEDEGYPGQDNTKRPIKKDFILNQPKYSKAKILLTRQNFGCGSSREHAPWAIVEYGFRAIIAPSFADIFFNNSFKNGLLPIVLPEETVQQLFDLEESRDGLSLEIDLPEQCIYDAAAEIEPIKFDVDSFRKHCLVNGLDDIGLTLQDAELIKQFEEQQKQESPWLYRGLN